MLFSQSFPLWISWTMTLKSTVPSTWAPGRPVTGSGRYQRA